MSAPGADGVSASEGNGGSGMNAVPDPPYDGDGRWDANGHEIPAHQREPQTGTPEWLGPIYDRMEQLGQQNHALVQAFQTAADAYEDDDYVELTPEQADALAQLSPEELAALDAELGGELDELDELYADDEYDDEPGGGDQIERLAEQIHQRWQSAEQAEHAIEHRDQAFDDLRDRMPVLHNEQTARRIVQQAQQLAESWDPNLINGPAFVDLVELVALASIAERATAQQNAEQAAQPQIQIESAAGGGSLGSDDGPREPDWGARMIAAAERLRPKI